LPERALRLKVLPLEPPVALASNLDGGRTVVKEAADGLKLECRVSGRPRPNIFWTLNGRPVKQTVNTTRVALLEGGQVLEISYVAATDEGLYTSIAKNKVGAWSSKQIVALRSTVEREEAYNYMSVPVIIAVVIAVVVVLVLVCLVKVCYDRKARGKGWKAPPSPPTPKLTQYELPQDEDDDSSVADCRRTLTNGSVSPVMSQAPYFNGGGGGGHCHCHMYTPCHSNMGTLQSVRSSRDNGGFPQHKCSICDFGQTTLPLNRMVSPLHPAAAGPRQPYQNGHGTLFRLGRARSRSPPPMAPRLSAEF
jgi:hypothetical protein